MSKHKPGRPASDAAEQATELSLEDTVEQKRRGVTPRVTTGASGYNPYDAVPSAPPAQPGKPTDLRKLSEWIRLTRQVAALKKDKPG
ncbi:MAG TPA: hypothetical protein VIX87_04830 [Steroidobacteraceae bacterium]